MSKNYGIALHVHHYRLWEWCYNLKERVDYIKMAKPPDEVPLRLKLLAIVPVGKIPLKAGISRSDYDEAEATHAKARAACDKAWAAFAQAASVKAWAACDKAEAACDKARDTLLGLIDREGMEKLHAELCPGCPWDGKTILKAKSRQV